MMKTTNLKSIRPRITEFVRAALVAVAFSWIPATVSSAQDLVEIDPVDNLVTIVADQADLKLILQELMLESNIKFWISENLPTRQLSLRIEKQPMEAVLRKLLEDVSYALVRADNATISAVYVLPEGEGKLADGLQPEANQDISQVIVDVTNNEVVADAINQLLENVSALGNAASSQTNPENMSPPSPPVDAIKSDAILEVLRQLQDSSSDIRQRLETDIRGIGTQ